MLKGVKIFLRNADYTLAPIPLGEVRDAWPKISMVVGYSASDPDSFGKLPDIIEAAGDVVLISLRGGNNPEMTREKLFADVLDYGNWREAFFAALAVSNIKLDRADTGKVPALAKIQTSMESSATSPAPLDGHSTTSASG